MNLGVASRLLTVILLSAGSHVALANAAGDVPPALRVAIEKATYQTNETKLTPSDGANTFGWSVAISGDTAVVASPFDDPAGDASGSAYVFARSAGVWSQQQKLTASDAAAGDYFGWSVAISGNTALVGASCGPFALETCQGSAYVFVRSAGVWSQQQKLTASDATAAFGASVSVIGDTAVVGAPLGVSAGFFSGSAYVFVRNAGVWSQQQKLAASVGAPGDGFGRSVSVIGDTAVVGASGSVYVFVRSAGVWSLQQNLAASDAAEGDQFGWSVGVGEDTAVVGSPYDDDAGDASGSAYVFVRSAGVWSQQQNLTASDAAVRSAFGLSVSVSGDTAVVGAPCDPDADGCATSAYVFARSAGVWSQQLKLTPSDAPPACLRCDAFGRSVALSGDTAVVGAPGSRSAYVYDPVSTLLSALSPAKVWVGLKNSDSVGLRLDLLAEVFIDATKVGQGELDNVGGGGSAFNNALLNTIPLALTGGPVGAPSGAQLSIRVSARRTCFGGGHNSGTARLWYNGRSVDVGASRDAGSRFDATIGGTTSDYYLRSGLALSTTAGSSRTSADASVNSSAPCPARPFTAFGIWSRTLP